METELNNQEALEEDEDAVIEDLELDEIDE